MSRFERHRNYLWSLMTVVLPVLLMFLLVSGPHQSAAVVTIEDNGYKGLVVAINKNVPENPELVKRIKVSWNLFSWNFSHQNKETPPQKKKDGGYCCFGSFSTNSILIGTFNPPFLTSSTLVIPTKEMSFVNEVHPGSFVSLPPIPPLNFCLLVVVVVPYRTEMTLNTI